MIEINLAKKKSQVNFAGVDLTKLPFKTIIAALAVKLFIPSFYADTFVEKKAKYNAQIKKIKKKIDVIKKEERRLADLKEQIDSFKIKTKELEERSVQVEKILRIKTNPNNLLENVARSLPEDVWLKTIAIRGNKLTLIGNSVSYQSIGLMLEKLRESPFFDERLRENSQKNIERQLDGEKVRLLEFKITGPIVRYNPF